MRRLREDGFCLRLAKVSDHLGISWWWVDAENMCQAYDEGGDTHFVHNAAFTGKEKLRDDGHDGQ